MACAWMYHAATGADTPIAYSHMPGQTRHRHPSRRNASHAKGNPMYKVGSLSRHAIATAAQDHARGHFLPVKDHSAKP